MPMIEGVPMFDCILLGMGPDGHTCSLFPGHPDFLRVRDEQAPDFKEWVIGVTGSPKPPPNRITLTPVILRTATSLIWVVTGDGKKEPVAEVIEGKSMRLPSDIVPRDQAVWFLDDSAAALVPEANKERL